MTVHQPPQKQQRQPGRESEMRPRPDYEPFFPGVGKLADQVALITGGDSGIGRAVAVAMAREGAKIAIAYLDEHADADETVQAVEREGSQCIRFAGDIGDPDFCREIVTKTVQQLGRLDILVNNAAEQHETKDFTRDSLRADRAHLPHQHLQHVLSHARGAQAHEEGRDHHQQHFGDRVSGPQDADRLRLDQGRDRLLHPGNGAKARRQEHPRQRGGAGPCLDAARFPLRSTSSMSPSTVVRRRWRATPSRTKSRPATCSWRAKK